MSEINRLVCRPAGPDTLDDLRRFTCENGKFGWCACMRWRLSSGAFKASDKPQRQAALWSRAEAGEPIGVLGYIDGVPRAWCAIAPRGALDALRRSRVLSPVDDAPVWSVVCFFIHRSLRRQGATAVLLRAAVAYAVESGARVVEGYPVEPGSASYTYMGAPATFIEAGFVDVTPPGRKRRVFRWTAP